VTIPVTDSEITQDIADVRRFVVWGSDTLAYRLADELVNRHNGTVTVIMPSRQHGYGALIAALGGVEIIEAEQVEGDALLLADLATAEALALLERDDVSNMDAALRAHEINPRLRLIVRMFNTGLGEGLAQLSYCTVLSDYAMAAPAFVAAALGESTSNLQLRDDSLRVALRQEVPQGDIMCGLAIADGRDDPELLPANQEAADVVLARVRRDDRTRGSRANRLTNHYPIRAVVSRVWRRLRLILGAFAGVLLVSTVILTWAHRDLSWWQAAYLSMLDAFGGVNADLGASTLEQATQTVLSFLSIALIPLLTATVVDAVVKSRLELRDGTLARRASGHVVVVGIGGVGSHVVKLLYDQGVDVVAVDRSANAPGVQVARELGIPVIIGDSGRRETLLAASLPTCRTLLAITSDDATNLETALIGRAINKDVPVVLRLFDDGFADRIQRAFNITVSRSVSYLAAPSFAARMLGQVLDTVSIGRHVLLAADLVVGANSTLENKTVSNLRRPHHSLLVELTNPNGQRLAPTSAAGRRLQRGDKLLVIATRKGLATLITETTAPPDSVPRKPIVLHDAHPFDQEPPQPLRPA
jgi:Trk K+ transport system NAD-binding subunit